MNMFTWSDVFVIPICFGLAGIIVWFKWRARMYPHQIFEDAMRDYNAAVERIIAEARAKQKQRHES